MAADPVKMYYPEHYISLGGENQYIAILLSYCLQIEKTHFRAIEIPSAPFFIGGNHV